MGERESEYLATARHGFLATADGDVTIIPICFVAHGDVLYTAIDEKPKSKTGTSALARVSNIASNPRVAVIVDNYTDDWRSLSYLLIHGEARLMPEEGGGDGAARARAMLLRKYPQYRWLGLGMAPILEIRVLRTKLWQFER